MGMSGRSPRGRPGQRASRVPRTDRDRPERERARPLAAVKRFGYQLQKLDVAAASRSEADLLVIDPEGDGPRLAPDAVARLRRKPSGQPRVILAYLSIGEAEDYRPYWQPALEGQPSFLARPREPRLAGQLRGSLLGPALAAPHSRCPGGTPRPDRGRGLRWCLPRHRRWLRVLGGARPARRPEPDDRLGPHDRQSRPEQAAELPGRPPERRSSGRASRAIFPWSTPSAAKTCISRAIVPRTARATWLEAEADLARFQKAGKPVFLIEYGKKPKTVRAVTERAREKGYITLITVRPL